MTKGVKIFSINHGQLVSAMAKKFRKEYSDSGYEIVGNLKVDVFSDGEMSPQLLNSVRGKVVFLIGSTTSSDEIIKFLLTIDAVKRASADSIVAVVPYFGYGRQDGKEGPRGAIGARVMAEHLQHAGIDKIMSIDLHAKQIQGFFRVPVDHIEGHNLFVKRIATEIERGDIINPTICTPDAGGAVRADRFMKKLNSIFEKKEVNVDITFAVINKKRDKPNSIESMELVGDVKNRDVIIIDDIIDTAGTLCKAGQLLMDNGARSTRAVITHPVLSGNAIKNLSSSCLEELIVSDTIDSVYEKQKLLSSVTQGCKMHIESCSWLLFKIINAGIKKHSIHAINQATV